MKNIVLFGAGKIGRSFIAQLFSKSGYEVIFIDINSDIIKALNEKKKYKVVIKGEYEETIWVEQVKGIEFNNTLSILNALEQTDLVATSVGQKALAHVIPILAKALQIRNNKTGHNPLDIIIAENIRNGDHFFRSELQKILPSNFPLDDSVGLIETSIGKMVPIMPIEEEKKDLLQVFAEPYNTLIVDKKGFKNPIPQIEGLAAKENIKAWVDRKSFIHNFGHAVVAYISFLYNPDFKFLYQALEVEEIKKILSQSMLESAAILVKKYPNEFLIEDLSEHVNDLIFRFQNKALGDTIYRVGSDLYRKLKFDDRIAAVLFEGFRLKMPINKIIFTLVCGYYFNATDNNGSKLESDVNFRKNLEIKGFETMLHEVSNIAVNNYPFALIALDLYNKINNNFKKEINFLLLN